MTHCDVIIGQVVTSSVKLHQEAPIFKDICGWATVYKEVNEKMTQELL